MAQADEIVIVTGLPRSGTSLVMQMLAAGGAGLLTDGARAADRNNPLGYFEYEPVKRTGRDTTWLAEAKGKAVKVVAPLVAWLPDGLRYRAIFIERDLDEVLASQAEMLRNLNAGEAVSDSPERRARLRREYARGGCSKERDGSARNGHPGPEI